MTEPEHFRIDVDLAERLIAEHMPSYPSATVPLDAAAGCVLRQTIVAERDQPPFDRATMDGIAISSTALPATRSFALAGIQAAGHAAQPLPDAGHCLEVMTGAVMPTGSDTVVPVERVEHEPDSNSMALAADYVPKPGQFVHKRASDHAHGATLLEPGVRLRGPELAILTAAGAAEVAVARWPRIAVVSTGDELVDVGQPISDYQIRSSNDRAIAGALAQRGCTTATRSHLPDDPAALLPAIEQLHTDNEVIILSGGVSMGKYDYIPGILKRLGVRVVFHKILQRPGLPMWFGISAAGKPVFALPGNPVSTLVCLTRFVLPALEQSLGLAARATPTVILQHDIEFTPDLCWLLPVQLECDAAGRQVARPQPTNTSGDFIGLAGTAGFVELPRGADHFSAGSTARFFPW